MRYYGPAQYAEVMTWPHRLIVRGIEIEGQREAQRQLISLRLNALADGMEQGKTYVPGSKDPPPDPSAARYDPKPYLQMIEALDRVVRPWYYALDKLIARRIAEEAAGFDAFEQAMGRLQA